MAHARIAKITIGKARGAQKKHLEKPIENDGGLAQKERALNIRRHRRAVNIGREHFARIAEQAMATPWVPRNPRPIKGPTDVREILELAA